MSKLNKLIKELCPNGVEYRKLGEVCELNRGVRVVKKDLSENGIFPVYQNSLTPLGYYDKSNYPSNTTFVISAGAAGEIGFAEKAIWAADDCLCVTCPDNISNKYVYYCLMNNKTFLFSKVRRASVPRLSRVAVEQFPLPLPPLPIQDEIVKILDRFAEYTAELQARKEQYEYYRNLLLTNNFAYGSADDKQKITGNAREEWKKMTLGEVGTFFGGLTGKSKEDFVNGNSKFITYKNIYSNPSLNIDIDDKVKILENEKQHIVKYGDILFTGSSETPDECGMSSVVTIPTEERLYLNSFCFGLRLNNIEDFNLNYLKHLLRSKEVRNQIRQTASGVTRYNVSKKRFANVSIPIPPITIQNEIAFILDKFEALVSDLTQGLPAEIAASQERYEYYRDKLLRFERCN